MQAAELAHLDRIATARVQAAFFRKSHPEYEGHQAPSAPPVPAPPPTPAQCEAMDDTWAEVTA